MTYAGPRRRVRESDLLTYERRGWVAEEKVDGCYVEIHIGTLPRIGTSPGRLDGGYDRRYWRGARRPGVVTRLVYRSGRDVPEATAADVLGRQTDWPDGTVLVGELMVSTPAAALHYQRHGVAGVVLFDVLRVGADRWDDLPNAARREQLERMTRDLDGKAARVFQVARHHWRAADLYREIVDGEGGEGVVLCDPLAPVGTGKLKAKRHDTVTCIVRRVFAEERLVELSLGTTGPTFYVVPPKIELAAGDLVDVAAMGTYLSDVPRHARIVRVREDLHP